MVAPTNMYYIWYGSQWDAASQNVLTNLGQHLGGSPYFNINTIYYNGSNVHVQNSVTLAGTTTNSGTYGTQLSDANIASIVSDAITSVKLPSDPNGVYIALTDHSTTATLTFTKLENALLEAVQRRDAEALGRLLADDFEIRSAAAPGVSTARAEAVRESLRAPVSRSSIDQMAVHEYGDVMLVSFLWTIADGAAPQSFFVVDTWKRSGDEWKAAVRYAAPIGQNAPMVPGTVAPSAQSLRKKI